MINFDISRYDVKSIIISNFFVGGMFNKSRLGSNQLIFDDIGVVERVKSDCYEFFSVVLCFFFIFIVIINFVMFIESDLLF